jgi:hypothetical protein
VSRRGGAISPDRQLQYRSVAGQPGEEFHGGRRVHPGVVLVIDVGPAVADCCDANTGAGQVATMVITSHGLRGVQDSAPANHYSLLSSIQQTFGLGCLQFTCDTANVQPITPLFAITRRDLGRQ